MRIKDQSRDWTPRLGSALLLRLLTGNTLIVRECASEMGVHPRTVRRYLQSIERSGWPLVVEYDSAQRRGSEVYYSLPKAWRLSSQS